MAMVTIKSENPNFSHVIRKNPNGKVPLYAATISAGKTYGFYTRKDGIVDEQEYNVVMTFESKQIDYENFEYDRNGNDRRVFLVNQGITKCFKSALNDDVAEDIPCKHSVIIRDVYVAGDANLIQNSPLSCDNVEYFNYENGTCDIAFEMQSSTKQCVHMTILVTKLLSGRACYGYEEIERIAKAINIVGLNGYAKDIATSILVHAHEKEYMVDFVSKLKFDKSANVCPVHPVKRGEITMGLIERLKDGALTAIAEDKMDPLMVTFTTEFNLRFEGMATKYSCQGIHPDGREGQAHVAFMCVEEKFVELVSMLRNVRDRVIKAYPQMRPNEMPVIKIHNKMSYLEPGKTFEVISIELPKRANSRYVNVADNFILELENMLN